MTNQYNHEAVKPKTVNNAKINNQEVKIRIRANYHLIWSE